MVEISFEQAKEFVGSVFSRRGDLRVEVIGNDGIRRYDYCSRQDIMAFNKYRIDPDGVFLTEIRDGKGRVRYEPTILFFENSTECVKKGEPSNPTPQEAGEAISQAAFSLARLMRKREDKTSEISLYLLIGTFIAAVAAAYFAFRGMGDISHVADLVTNWLPSVLQTSPAPQPTIPNVPPTIPNVPPTIPARW